MKFPEFKIRCSQIATIMPYPTKKEMGVGETLSKGCKTYLNQWIGELLHESKDEVHTKYMDKGNIMEDDAIDMLADYLNVGMLVKNTTQYENDFMTGEPDVVTTKLIPDTKCSWSSKTFPLMATELPDPNYAWQILGYLDLTNREKGLIAYCLLDTPMHIIESEAWSYCRRNGYNELDEQVLARYVKNMTYDNIPRKYRINTFDIQRDQEKIEAIHNKVLDCRKYVKQQLAVLVAREDF